MRLPFVPRREHDRRIRTKDEKIGKLAQQLDDEAAANKRLDGRNKELRRRLDTAHDGQLVDLEAHDAHRKALADTLGDQKRHLNWDELIAEVARLNKAAHAWMADYEAEKQRADRFASYLDDGDRKAIKQWEQRVKAHDAWTRPADPEARPVDGASGRPTHPATELRRALDRCLALEARLAVAEGRNRKAVAS